MTYMLVPRLQFIRNFNKSNEDRDFDLVVVPLSCLPAWCRSFTLWYVAYALLTVGNLLDNMTNSVFAARVWASRNCPSGHRYQQIWDRVLQNSSIFGLLPNCDFAFLTVFLYVVQVIIIPAYAVYKAVPRPDCCGGAMFDHSTGEIREGWSPKYHMCTKPDDHPELYLTFADGKHEGGKQEDWTDHSQALNVLEECNNMANLASQDMKVRKAMLNKWSGDELPETDDHISCRRSTALGELAIDSLTRATARFVLKGLFRNCLQLNLQVSMIGLQRFLYNAVHAEVLEETHVGFSQLGESVDLFNAITVLITILAMFVDMPDVISYFRFAAKVEKEAKKGDDDFIHAHQKTIKRMRIGLYCFVPIWIVLSILALSKLVMVFVCTSGEWNAPLRFWDPVSGCISVPKDMNLAD